MKKFLVGTMMFIVLEAFIIYKSDAAVTFQQVKNVWDKLQNTAGYHIKLKYDGNEKSNAYCDGYSVYITQGMLNDLQNDSQIAMVLGHELAHYVKRRATELEADGIGYFFCKKAGYKQCLSFLKRMRQLYGDSGDDVHPSWTKRLENLK